MKLISKSFSLFAFLLGTVSGHGQEVRLLGYDLTPCDVHHHDTFTIDKLISFEYLPNSDTAYVMFSFQENCAADRLQPKIRLMDSTLAISLQQESKIYAFCTCCFTMRLTLHDPERLVKNFWFEPTKRMLTKEGLKIANGIAEDIPPLPDEPPTNEPHNHR